MTTATATTNTSAAKLLFTIRIDTKLLVNRLAEVPPGETISYAELGSVIKQVANYMQAPMAGYGSLCSARRIALRDHGQVFRTVAREGLRRLTDAEIVQEVPDETRKMIRRRVDRAGREIIAVAYDQLDNSQKVKHNASLSVLGAIGLALIPAKVKQIEAACEKSHQQLSLTQTLEIFQEA